MLELVVCDLASTDALLAVEALDHGKRTAFQMTLGRLVRVQMLVQLSQSTNPRAAAEAMGAVDAETIQRSFEALVDHGSEIRLVTQRTWLFIFRDTLDALGTKTVSTTVDNVRLAQDMQADGALTLKRFRRRLNELAFIARPPSLLVVDRQPSIASHDPAPEL